MKPLLISLVMLLAVLGSGCAEPTATSATLAAIVASPDGYDGQRVQVTGVLRSFPQPLHYWIEDPQLNRVEVLFDEDLARWLGQNVRVRGRFSFDTEAGRRIRVEDLVGTATLVE